MEAILIPVKRLQDGKARLAVRLSPADRRNLGLAMLSDVLCASAPWPLRAVVTSDPDASAAAAAAGCRVLADPGRGLNQAIEAATRQLIDQGAAKVLVLPCDVPLAATAELAALFTSGGVALAPSWDGGTNALMRSPPDVIRPAFGPDSAGAHRKQADAAGVGFTLLALPSLQLDVDSWSDVEKLAAQTSRRQSAALAVDLVNREKVGEVP